MAGDVYLHVDVGEQTFNVQLDTGSTDLAVPSATCKHCNHTDPVRMVARLTGERAA